MDSPSSESAHCRLSLSLQSYGSDEEDIDSFSNDLNPSSHTLVPDHLENNLPDSGVLSASKPSHDEDIISKITAHLGLSGISQDKLEQLSTAVEKMRASQLKYIQRHMVLDAVKTVARASNLPPQTSQRINNVLNHISLLDYVSPNDMESKYGLFGLSQHHLHEYMPNELTAVDQKVLQEAVFQELVLKHDKLTQLDHKYFDILSKISGSVVNTSRNIIDNSSTYRLLSLRRELDHEISTCETLMSKLDKLLSALTKMKLQVMYQINSERVALFQTKCDILKSEIQTLNKQIISQIQSEDPKLIDAYSSLKNNLDVAVDKAKSHLLSLQKSDIDYDKLRGTHFDGLLKEYIDLKRKIDQKRSALEKIN